MKIALGADSAGFAMKQKLIAHLNERGFEKLTGFKATLSNEDMQEKTLLHPIFVPLFFTLFRIVVCCNHTWIFIMSS